MAKISDKTKKIANETIATVDTALAILSEYPELDINNFEVSSGFRFNPLKYLLILLRRTKGYNKFYEYIIDDMTNFLIITLPSINTAIKMLLIEQLTKFISCSVNPFITEELLRDGVVINLDEIDISEFLRFTPLDKRLGAFLYSNTANMKTHLDLAYSNDMDAFIWFVKNRANRRYVWKPEKARVRDFLGRFEKPFGDFNPSYKVRSGKDDGIITLSYCDKASKLRNACGELRQIQVPHDDCLQVFIGDVREKKEGIQELLNNEKATRKRDSDIKDKIDKIKLEEKTIENIEREKVGLNARLKGGRINKEEYEAAYSKQQQEIQKSQGILDKHKEELSKLVDEKKKNAFDLQTILTSLSNPQTLTDLFFPFNQLASRNYYYGKTLLEFNTDYIMSLDLLDAKVVVAQIIDAITGALSVDIGLSYKRQLVKNEIKKMVTMVIENDDIVVSDCFFTFSNEDYDEMSRRTELQKAGITVIDGQDVAKEIDVDSILSQLNDLNDTSTPEEMREVINGTLRNLTKELTSSDYEVKGTFDSSFRVDIFENFLLNLALAVISPILTPKVYLIFLINFKILGKEPSFNWEEFWKMFQNFISLLVKLIADKVVAYFAAILMKQLDELVRQISTKLAMEQAAYYVKLIRKLIDCFKRNKSTLGFTVDDVDYADILPEDSEPINSEC